MIFQIEIEREDDGRWIAEVPELPGVVVYGTDRASAIGKVQALALRVLAERLEHGEPIPEPPSVSSVPAGMILDPSLRCLKMSTNLRSEILRLSVAERIQLVEDIWDSIAAEASAVEMSDEIREELDRRLDDQEANPGVGHSWPEVKARLLATARDADITARLNSVYGDEPEDGLSPGLRQAQAASVAKLDSSGEDAALVRAIQEGEATELVSRDEVMSALQERAHRASRERYEAALSEVPDVEPDEHDRL